MLGPANPPAAHRMPSSSEWKRQRPPHRRGGELGTCTVRTTSRPVRPTKSVKPFRLPDVLKPGEPQKTSTTSLADPGPLQTFLKRKRSPRVPAEPALSLSWRLRGFPAWEDSKYRKKAKQPRIPAPNPEPHIEQITSLKRPPPAAAEIQKSSSPSFGANLEERLRLGTPRAPPGPPRPQRRARELVTAEEFQPAVSGDTACSPPEPGQSHPGWETQRQEEQSSFPQPLDRSSGFTARAAPRTGPSLRFPA